MPAHPAERRFPALLLGGVCLLLTLLAIVPATRLRIVSNLEDILPRDDPAADSYRDFVKTFGGFDRLYILIEFPPGNDSETLAESAIDFAERLEQNPSIAWARHGAAIEDEDFLMNVWLPHAVWAAATLDPEGFAERIDPAQLPKRAAGIRNRLLGPLGEMESEIDLHDPFGFSETLPLDRWLGAGTDAEDALWISRDGQRALVVAAPRQMRVDPALGRELASAIKDAAEEILTASEGQVHSAGGAIYAAQDERIIRGDVMRTVIGSALAVMLVLVLTFGGFRSPSILIVSIAVAILWTAAGARVLWGSLSALGLTFASILIGLGVDYGIHGLTVFRQRRASGDRPQLALWTTVRETGPGILSSAATTAAAFLVLTAARLVPVRELGGVTALGIGAVLLATVGVAGPLLLWTSRDGERTGGGPLWSGLGRLADAMVQFSRRQSMWVGVLAVTVSIGALAGLPRLKFDGDLRALRPDDHPALVVEQALTESFDWPLDAVHLMVRGANSAEALQRAGAIAEGLQEELPAGAVLTTPVLAWNAFYPTQQVRARVASVDWDALGRRFAAELERQGLRSEAWRAGWEVPQQGSPERGVTDIEGSIPPWFRESLAETVEGTKVALRIDLSAELIGKFPTEEWVIALEAQHPELKVASVARLGRSLAERGRNELWRLAAWMLSAMALVLLISFRGRWQDALRALTPVLLGLLWTLGALAWIRGSIDMFALSLLPLLLGIGIDDGLHTVHAWRRHGRASLAVHGIGRALVLTSVTTVLGFGSLVTSHIPGLRTAGGVICLGILLCLGATLVVLPMLLPDRQKELE